MRDPDNSTLLLAGADLEEVYLGMAFHAQMIEEANVDYNSLSGIWGNEGDVVNSNTTVTSALAAVGITVAASDLPASVDENDVPGFNNHSSNIETILNTYLQTQYGVGIGGIDEIYVQLMEAYVNTYAGTPPTLDNNTGEILDLIPQCFTAQTPIAMYDGTTKPIEAFAQTATKTIAFEGNAVLKQDVAEGWTTYNFEVRAHHNYVANGIRVHNDSILSALQEGDTLVALNGDLTDAAVLRDVNGDGIADFVTLDGYRRDGEATAIALERVYYWDDANRDNRWALLGHLFCRGRHFQPRKRRRYSRIPRVNRSDQRSCH